VKIFIASICAALFLVQPTLSVPFAAASGLAAAAPVPDDIMKEYDETCTVTEDSDQLTKEELRQIIARCNALQPRVEKLEDPARKVMLSRIKRCREFYAYLLEIKESK